MVEDDLAEDSQNEMKFDEQQITDVVKRFFAQSSD
jgi:hypothetical protein